MRSRLVLMTMLLTMFVGIPLAASDDALPSWREGDAKQAIVDFVRRVAMVGGPDFVPMLELQTYLRANGFKTYIVSGVGIEFMRPWTEKVYGIPPEQVVGSSIKAKFELRGTTPVLVRLPKINFIDDKQGKPVGINQHIGRRPILAFGNSDGDLQMLQWTAAGPGPRFMGLVHHTDKDREWAYDRASGVGRLDQALDEAKTKGWILVDMKQDWKLIFPYQK